MTGDIEKLFEELRHEASERKRISKMLVSGAAGVMAVVLVVFIVGVFTTGKGAPNLTTLLPIFTSLIVLTTVYSQKHKSLVAEIAARKDPRILGHLLEAAHAGDEEIKKLAESSLPDILGVWLSGENELEPEHRGLLYKLLDEKRPLELVEACLIAVRAIGGLEAVPYLESLQRRTQQHKVTRWQRVSTKCLETLADVRIREARRIIDAGPIRDDVEVQEQTA